MAVAIYKHMYFLRHLTACYYCTYLAFDRTFVWKIVENCVILYQSS